MTLAATWRAIRSPLDGHFPRFMPDVHPVAAWFILRRLKRLGYSNTKVTSTDKGIVVHATK